MDTIWLGLGSALWLGVLTSISPCPLATNIAAISFVGRQTNHPGMVILTGLLYTLGRTLVYCVLGSLLVSSILSSPQLSMWLQHYMNKLLGPLLILIGMVLLGLLSFPTTQTGVSEKMQDRLKRSGIWGGLLLGIVFALSFCPVSAALFFGSLIPLAVQQHSTIALPISYGIGTALPVLVFAIAISLGVKALGMAFANVTRLEKLARPATGVIFIGAGVYLTLSHVFQVI